MHRHASSAHALRAVCVRRMQRMHAGRGLQVQLRDVRVDHHEAPLTEHRALGQSGSASL